MWYQLVLQMEPEIPSTDIMPARQRRVNEDHVLQTYQSLHALGQWFPPCCRLAPVSTTILNEIKLGPGHHTAPRINRYRSQFNNSSTNQKGGMKKGSQPFKNKQQS
jgi:hypothetical protein